ncbi:MAG: YajQ family cyclic di-GMP-binding protein [Candidatus Omnitrophica bacterium]|nr:YajQ family cyclic di-GMP-binding protein [Candidatus Omnitrophota bacterium]
MANFSFDIVSEVDLQEVDNAVNQAKKEASQRYDFKNAKFSIDYSREEKKITLLASDDFKIKALKDILSGRLTARKIPLKAVSFKEPQKTFEGNLIQTIDIACGIPKEKAKELVAIIKDLRLKVQPQIEAEKVRVFSPKKDDLQTVITHLRSIDFPLPLQFCNYR